MNNQQSLLGADSQESRPDTQSNIPIHLVTLGCARNETDSEELAARLFDGGFELVTSPDDAQVIVVNTCGFIEQAKKDSIDTLLAASDYKTSGSTKAVVAVGCMAQRYGNQLADALPEADAVLGFDDYPQISAKIRQILAGGHQPSHQPQDRRQLLPLAPIDRSKSKISLPGHGQSDDDFLKPGIGPLSGPPIVRRRLGKGPYAPLKIASGCDRRCAFCAIPSFRGSYISRPIEQIVNEAQWLANQGVSEVMLVSENTSSYGKDFGQRQALIKLLNQLNQIEELKWIRVSYLQPAEIYDGLIETIAGLEKIVPYFDLSFQHASNKVLRRMRRFGDADSFMKLINKIRHLSPNAGIRSNFITGFPGESQEDFQILQEFLEEANLDTVGIFGYSDEETTEAATLDHHLDNQIVNERVEILTDLVNQLMDQRAASRINEDVHVLIERIEDDQMIGRSAHQGPDVDGVTILTQSANSGIGEIIPATIVDTFGVDLIAQPR